MSKHTPGPWKDGPVFNKDGRGIFFTDTSKPGKWQRRVDGGHCGTFDVADARLIAAAPDLLRELEHLVRLLEPAISDGRVSVPGLATLNGARAAIAKAEGGAS